MTEQPYTVDDLMVDTARLCHLLEAASDVTTGADDDNHVMASALVSIARDFAKRIDRTIEANYQALRKGEAA